ncbi:hypothetical protein ACLBWS_18085 [Brucellaceae bacterium D45D]
MSEISKEQHQQNISIAQRSFDNHRGFISDTNGHMVEMAGLAIKAPALVAAGGIAALLAFYSANWKDISKLSASIETFNTIIYYLFLSLIFSMLAPCFAYFCTYFIAASASNQKYSYQHPYVHSNRKSKSYRLISEFFRFLTIACVLVSIILIILSGQTFLDFVHPFTLSGNAGVAS